MKRKSLLTRSTRIKPMNAKRKAKEFARAYESEERVLWVRSLPSVVSGRGPCENAHIRSRGAGGGSADIVPLTASEHGDFHGWGRKEFEKRFGVDLASEARRIERLWQDVKNDKA